MKTLEMALRTIRQKPGLYRFFLHVSTCCFEKSIKVRNFFYDIGWKKKRKAPLPVVSIGNVAVGGTGKTPFTIFLARALQSHARIAVLTRGYRSLAEKRTKPVIVSTGEGEDPLHSPEVVGDEAYLIAKNLPNVIVISGKNRFLGIVEAKKQGAQLVLLDDGMQHRKLSRDIDIAMMNGQEHNEKFLPSGSLRDDPKRLAEVDFLVSSGQEFLDTIAVGFRVVGIVDEKGMIQESLNGLPVAIFCGIARPESFVQTVEGCAGRIVDALFLADHEKVDDTRLNTFSQEAKKKGACALLCTEKDFVKYENHSFALPMLWVKREMYITGNPHKWDALIQRIRGLVV